MSRPRVSVLTHDQGFAPLAWLYSFKARATLTRVIAQALRVPEPQASLLTGILLGDDSGIPKSVQEAFRTTGTSLQSAAKCKTKPDLAFVLTRTLASEFGCVAMVAGSLGLLSHAVSFARFGSFLIFEGRV